MGYLYLAGAIVTEIAGTLALQASNGLSRPLYTLVVVVGYVASFVLLAGALTRGIPLGVAYGIWSAVGVAAVALLSIPLFGQSLSAVQGVGLVLVAAGVYALEAGGAH